MSHDFCRISIVSSECGTVDSLFPYGRVMRVFLSKERGENIFRDIKSMWKATFEARDEWTGQEILRGKGWQHAYGNVGLTQSLA